MLFILVHLVCLRRAAFPGQFQPPSAGHQSSQPNRLVQRRTLTTAYWNREHMTPFEQKQTIRVVPECRTTHFFRPLSSWPSHLVSWCWWSLLSHSTTRMPPFPTRLCAQVLAGVSGGSLRACWMQRFGQEDSRLAWRCRKLQQSSTQVREASESTKTNFCHKNKADLLGFGHLETFNNLRGRAGMYFSSGGYLKR